MKRKNGLIALSDADWFVITASEDEICLTGTETKKTAENLLYERFQASLPEELTGEYLETMYEGMKENMAEGRYVDRDEFEEISNRYFDAVNHIFDYDGAYFDGKTACYRSQKARTCSGKPVQVYESGMAGAIFDRNAFDGRYIVVWNDECEIHHADFKTRNEAVQKLRELFLASVPEEKQKEPDFNQMVATMSLEETDMELVDDMAFNALVNPCFNAIIGDVGHAA